MPGGRGRGVRSPALGGVCQCRPRAQGWWEQAGCIVVQRRGVGFGGGDRLILTEKMDKGGVITEKGAVDLRSGGLHCDIGKPSIPLHRRFFIWKMRTATPSVLPLGHFRSAAGPRLWDPACAGMSAQVCAVTELPGLPLMMEGCPPGLVPKAAWGLSVLVTLCFSQARTSGCTSAAHAGPFPQGKEQCLAPATISGARVLLSAIVILLFSKRFVSSQNLHKRRGPPLLHLSHTQQLVLRLCFKTIGLGCNNTDVFASRENHEFPLLSPQ